jgi:multiple sugar transport system substrate-binding protein
VLSLVLTGVLLGAAAFASGKQEAQKAGVYAGIEITIPVLAGPSGDAVKKLSPQFEALTGMKVNVEILSHDELWKKMELDAASKAGNFDAYHLNYFKLDEYRNSKAIVPLKQYIQGDVSKFSDAKWDDFAAALVAAASAREGDFWAIPHMGDTRLLWYNKELFAAAGLSKAPDTFEEFVSYGQKMTKPDGSQYGLGVELQKYIYVLDMFHAYLSSVGGQFFDKSWKARVNTPEGKKALKFMYDLVNTWKVAPPDVVNWGHTELTNGIVTGYVAMVPQWHVFIPQAEDPSASKVAGKLGYTVVPGIKQADGSIRRRDSLGCWAFAVSAGSKHPKETYAYLEWLKSPEIDVQYALLGGTATRVSTNNDPRVVKQVPWSPAVGKSLAEITMPLPIIPNFTEWADAIGTEIHKALVGQASVDEVLANADEISNRMMKEIGYPK